MAYATPHWQEAAVDWTAEDLYRGTGRFRLTDRDLALLSGLFENNYMLGRHIAGYCSERGLVFPGRQAFSQRMIRLFRHGLVAKAKVLPRGIGRTYEYVYSLTALGLSVLVHGGHNLAGQSQDWWKPPHHYKGRRNNVWHQLAVVDLVQGLAAYGKYNGREVFWVGSRFIEQRISAQRAGGMPLILDPDAALQVGVSHVLLLEHQRSIDTDQITRKLTKYQRYAAIEGWRGVYHRAPQLLFSVNDVSDTQHHSRDPVALVADIARGLYLRNCLVLPESESRRLRWGVTTIDHPHPMDLWEALDRL